MSGAAGVNALAEIVLWSTDLKASMRFYRDLFGLELISPPDFPNKFLSSGEGPGGVPMMIVLVPHSAGAGFPREKPRRVLHHLAFSVRPDSYDRLEARCREAGLEVRSGKHPILAGVRTFYVDDPDGNEVEIIAPGP